MLARMLASWVKSVRKAGASDSAFPVERVVEVARERILSTDWRGAEAVLRDCARSSAPSAEIFRMLGSVLGAQGRVTEARDVLERAVALDPNALAGLSDLGNAYFLLEQLPQAERCYRAALNLDPGNRLVRLSIARIDERLGRIEAAIDGYKALLGPPALVAALQDLVAMLDRLGRVEDAKSLCRLVLSREPDVGAAEAALGFLLLKRDLAPQAALEHIDRALLRGYRADDVLANRGIALQDLRRLDEAITSYDDALTINPDHHSARFHRALARLLRYEFEHAWQDYEVRLLGEGAPVAPRALPSWNGEAQSRSPLLIYGEQGIGDEIMFASCLPDAQRRCPKIVLVCAPKLETLFRRSFPAVTVFNTERAKHPHAADELSRATSMIPIGSLPLHFRPSLESFPRHDGYLKADSELVALYRSRLVSLGAGLKVGLSWRGGTLRSRAAMRTLTSEQLGIVFETPGVRFVNLQYDSDGEEAAISAARRSGKLVHWSEALADYDHTAALVASLDLVLSVCTAVIHLAGALGKPVWIMAPFSPEWRYGVAGDRMPWYPSATVIRQSTPGDWKSVIDTVQQGLSALVSVPG